MRALSQPDTGRELATEFLERQAVRLGQRLLEQRLGGLRGRAEAIWRAMVGTMDGDKRKRNNSNRRSEHGTSDHAEHFETTTRPAHVTFDDDRVSCRNFPWMHFVEARWDYGIPDTIRVEIGGWAVVPSCYNIGPLFAAVEEQSLLRVRALPGLAGASGEDTYETEIHFVRPQLSNAKARIERKSAVEV